MLEKRIVLSIILLLLLKSIITGQGIVINEIMSSNSSAYYDEFGDTPDWIELINWSDQVINLSQYSLSDDILSPQKWIFPSIELLPSDIVLINASGRNLKTIIAHEEKPYIRGLHTNFSISNGNESIYLFNNVGNLIDSVGAILLPENISYGRNMDDINNWSLFLIPTPGLENNTEAYTSKVEPPEINLSSGFYSSNLTIEHTNNDPRINTFYTLDGSEPTTDSRNLINPLILDKTTVVKVKSFKTGFLPSETITNTYFVDEESDIKVISLSTSPENLWDENSGIYVLGNNAESEIPFYGANFWEDWEKSATLELFDKNKINQINVDVDIKIFGGWSRANEQKSLAIFTNKSGPINFKIFPNLDIENFKSLVLRNSGNDWNSTMMRDGFIHSIADDLDIDHLGFEPSVLFLNGKYWGIHNIREKLNLNYISSHFNVEKQNIDFLELDGEIIDGTNEDYFELREFISNSDLSNNDNYNIVSNSIDIKSFIDYNILQIYIANTDWPGNNVKYWKDRSETGKWRWILFDTDFGFGWIYGEDYQHNTLSFTLETNGQDWPNPPWSTLFLRKLLENTNFKNKFISRYADLINTELGSAKLNNKISIMADQIRSEMPNHIQKWNQFSLSNWESNLSVMRRFADSRASYLNEYFREQFGLSGISKINVTLSQPNSGKVQVNTIIPNLYPWSGNYFNDITLKLIPRPELGYIFTGWSGGVSSSNDTLVLDIKNSLNITANFQPKIDHPGVVINEINYNSNSSVDTEDWIELYNNSENLIDLSNWILKDEVDTNIFVFPNSIFILPRDYLVICRDTSSFNNYFNDNIITVGNFEFGLNNSGDLIRLFTDNEVLVDSVRYDDAAPWPVTPDGIGNTLELVNPDLENSSYVNWKSSFDFGSPGTINTIFSTDVERIEEEKYDEFTLSQNYPNPFNPSTTIKYSVPYTINNDETLLQITIFDILGRRVKTLVNEMKTYGNYEINFNATELTSGIYFYQLKVGEYLKTKKMVLLK